jgi:exonuclease SbcC
MKADAEATLRRQEKVAADLEAARDQRAAAIADLDQLTTLERAFGRDGVPAWIVEQQAIPAIEAEANRILAELGGPVTHVELRTERELKGGGTRDALDIVCVTDAGAREYATFSGGERCRVDVALRLGLARLLATRRGAEIRWLALDEPDALDEQGMQALAGVLRGLVQDGVVDSVLLASHVPTLRDSFDASLIVTRNGAGSTVEAA